jgi:DNA topoisomerase-2
MAKELPNYKFTMAASALELSASQFIDDKLRLYSAHSNIRGIPFIGDGFKQSHRKALWGMMRRGENADKDTVERIAAAGASATDYHHGVGSFEGTIVGMAQDYAGSNNLPLFEAHGQFGNRLNKLASASRYIKTKFSPIFRQLFRKEDDLIFEHNMSNGMAVEPKYFTPILPLVLINGAEGMGTGHSTYILSYKPDDIRAAVLKLLDGKTLKPNGLLPWWRGFNGTVSRDPVSGQISIEGKYELKEGRSPTITITELPIGAQSDSYEAVLQKLEDKGVIVSYDNLSDKRGFEFIVSIPRIATMMSDEEIKKTFKLISRETENLTVWDGDGVLTRYETVEDLLTEWTVWRVERYEDRRLALIKKIEADITWASLKIRFIRFYLANYKYFRDTANKELNARLIAEGFDRHDELLAMPMRNLTHDKIKELEADVEDLKLKLASLQKDNAIEMFKRELKELKL